MERTEQPYSFQQHHNRLSDTMAALATSGKFMISHLQPHAQHLPHLVKPGIDHYPQSYCTPSELYIDPYLSGGGGGVGGGTGQLLDPTARYGPNLLTRYDPGSNPASQTGYYADYYQHTRTNTGGPRITVPAAALLGHPVSKSKVVSSGDGGGAGEPRLNNYDYRHGGGAGDRFYRGGFNPFDTSASAPPRARGRGLVGGILKNNINPTAPGQREYGRDRGSVRSYQQQQQQQHPLIYDPKQYEQCCYNNVGANSNSNSNSGPPYHHRAPPVPPPPAGVKNTNSAERNYNVNYSLNFTKNQYNILISPPLHPDLRPRIAVPPEYDDDHQQQQQQQHHHHGAPDVKRTTGSHYQRERPAVVKHQQQQQQQQQHRDQPVSAQEEQQDIKQHEKQPHQHQPGLILSEKQLLAQQEAYASTGKMQREEIIIEHSQLMGGDGGPGAIIHPAGGQHPGAGGIGGQHGSDRRTGSKGLGAFGVIGQSHHFTQIIAALAVSLGPLAAGLGKGYSSPAIDSLQDLRGNFTHFSVNDQQVSWIASLSLLGALFGGMFGGLAMQFGRKRVLTLMSLPFSISWILTMFAKSVETMFVTAFVGGFCCAIVSSVAQVYVSEIASPDIRGFLSAIQKIAGHFGMLISYLVGAYLDWRQLAMLIAMAPIMLFISVIYIPETPSFLVLRGCDEEAHRSLQWLRGPHKNVELELDTIRSNVRTSRMNLLNRMTPSSVATSSNGVTNGMPNGDTAQQLPFAEQRGRRGLRDYLELVSFEALVVNVKSVLRNVRLVKPILITCGLMIFQRFTGASSFNFYAVTIFRKTFAGMNPHGAAIAVGFVQLLASMLSGLLIDTVGRIPLLIVSSIFMSLALAGFGSCVYYGETSKMLLAAGNGALADVAVANGQNDWIPLLCVLVFTVAFALGISPISWLLVGELFPLEYRAIGSSIATSFSYFCAFLSVKTFVDFQSFLGLHGTFWLYACISCVGLFFVVMVVPETKGRDLEEMDPRYVRTLTINR
ncbi:uncharacterized protein LOC125959039 [Anopheles darlingi]|uniref:uncharacterized protein LOC125959039 n=1 Tax=Anopheles darlingi TaxID=43151 RepID=UPI00210040DB|nr:uncharacterized protein LOC125959039 [Anopheles darlingi]XP_049547726.1 uncharacterized protein LOC125959039 [Anopheles darlingi]